jgi:aryl-alcohol dehydrogenase-like predicted oxidoreductase
MKKDKILLPKDVSELKYPWLWIGTWSMGGEGFGIHDERESMEVLKSAVESGIHHFDTAGFYAHGRSENLLRNIIKHDREAFFISTKGGLVWDGRRVEHRASPGELEDQLNVSMERLQVDYLDLYQLHWPDPEIPVQDSIDALRGMQENGLIRHWGIGNLTAQQVNENLKTEENIPHQVHFNPIRKSHSVLEEGRDRCVNCIITPLEQGLLGSGRSSLGRDAISSRDIRNRNPYFSNPNVLEWNKRLDDLCHERSMAKVSIVLTWICSQRYVNAIIPGPRKPEQFKGIMSAVSFMKGNGLFESGNADTILSPERAKTAVPPEIWRHLDEGPDI